MAAIPGLVLYPPPSNATHEQLMEYAAVLGAMGQPGAHRIETIRRILAAYNARWPEAVPHVRGFG